MKERAVSGSVIFDRFRGDLSARRCSLCPKAPGAGVGQGALCLALRLFVRWRRAGVWDRIIDVLAATHDAAVQMIDTS